MAFERAPLTEGSLKTPLFQNADDPAGRILFERFLIERELTDPMWGHLCSSYLAKDLKHFCRWVVLKTITPTDSSSFQDICETLIRVDHPNIERILETGRLFDGMPYAVTTYAPSRSLGELLSGERRLVLDRIANIVDTLSAALEAAHSQKIIHADVAPWNILITSEENDADVVRLANFGCLWPADPGRSRFVARSGYELWLYTAPELLVEDGRATTASDIYSLAAVAYRMLTGEAPFVAEDRSKMLELIVHGLPTGRAKLRTDLSVDATAMVLSALQYKPLRRPRDVRAFGLELANELRRGPRAVNTSTPITVEQPAVITEDPVIEISVEKPLAGEPVSEPRRKQVPKAPAFVSDRAVAWALITLLLAGALSIPIGQTILDEGEKPAEVNSIAKKSSDTKPAREIRFSIQQPAAGGQQNLQNGGSYGITFEADAPGNAYAFGETTDADGKPAFNVLYPVMPGAKDGTGRIAPHQEVKTRPLHFGDPDNPGIVWLVWTAGKLDDLESAGSIALQAEGTIRNETDVQRVRHFLERNKTNKLEILRDSKNGQTVLKGTGDRIVYRIEIGRG